MWFLNTLCTVICVLIAFLLHKMVTGVTETWWWRIIICNSTCL